MPANFIRIVGANILTQTGDALINPKTVLGLAVVAIGVIAFLLRGAVAGIAVLSAVVVFSLARGL